MIWIIRGPVAAMVIAGMAFGALLTLVPLVLGLCLGAHLGNALCLLLGVALGLFGVALGALAFSSMGVLMAAPPTNAPSQIMMRSSLVRLPRILISAYSCRTPTCRHGASFSRRCRRFPAVRT